MWGLRSCCCSQGRGPGRHLKDDLSSDPEIIEVPKEAKKKGLLLALFLRHSSVERPRREEFFRCSSPSRGAFMMTCRLECEEGRPAAAIGAPRAVLTGSR